MPFIKGHPKIAGRAKGSKNKVTIDREAKRKLLEEKIAEFWDEITDALLERSQTDFSALRYVIDQSIGKPTKSIDVTSNNEKISGIVILPAKNGEIVND